MPVTFSVSLVVMSPPRMMVWLFGTVTKVQKLAGADDVERCRCPDGLTNDVITTKAI
jgi:hypothetical protein